MPILINTVLAALTMSASFWTVYGVLRVGQVLTILAGVTVYDIYGLEVVFDISGKRYFRQDFLDLVQSETKKIFWQHIPVALLLYGGYYITSQQ